MIKAILSTLLFCVAIQAAAQSTITGQILGPNNTPVEFANITLHHSSDSVLVKGAISSTSGHFEILFHKEGSYFLQCSFVGYQNAMVPNVVLSTEQKALDLGTIALTPISTDLEQVTVRAQKPFIERRLDKLIVNVESSIVSSGSNVLELLEQSPNVFVDQSGTISLRGRQGVIVMMDGKRMRLSGDELANMLRSMPSSTLETIEIITNPSAKYDAEGSAGIIDLRSKRNKRHGTNGNVALSVGHGKYEKLNGSVNLNYRNKWINIYSRLAYNQGRYFNNLLVQRKFRDNGQITQVYDQNNFNIFPSRSYSPRFGIDFTPSAKTTIGFLANSSFSTFRNDADNHARILDSEGIEQSTFATTSDIKNHWNNYNINGNLRQKIGAKGRLLTADIDYARYWTDTEQLFNTTFFEGTTPTGTDYLRGDHGGYLNLYATKIDYEHPIGSTQKLEAGLKSSWVKADNDLNFFILENGQERLDLRQSNHFIYEENINAAYLNWSREQGKWNLQVGLRGEQTIAEGLQVAIDSTFQRDYLQLFPSAFLNYTVSENHLFGLSVSRRINRPSYRQLNPFRAFVDPSTFREGNPFLLPQLTWSAELTHTFLQRFTTTLSYSRTIDNITMVFLQNDEERQVTVTHINLEGYEYFGIGINGNFSVTKDWSSRFNAQLNYNHFKGSVAGNHLNSAMPSFTFSNNNNISLPKGFSAELGGYYIHRQTIGITTIHPMWALNVGVQKSLWNRRGSLRLNVRDIFYKSWPRGTTRFANIDETFDGLRERRVAMLSFSWRFGKQSVQPSRRRQTGAEEEMRRARQGDG